ncbi:MAG: hypothetical protein WBO35_05945 [Candidatus Saccharimonadales bacterium]
MLTLAQAAKETGLTRSAIFKAIKGGKLSATKDEQGHFQIDPAELFRVYKPFHSKAATGEQQETNNETKETAETRELRARLEMSSQLLRQLESERDDLRRRLDEEAAERRKLTALLTHQPPAAAATTNEPQKPPPSFLRRLFGNR